MILQIFLIIMALSFVGFSLTEAEGAAYIKFDGIDGEYADKDHKNWIEVLSFSEDESQSNIQDGLEKIDSEIVFRKHVDKASPKLAESVANGVKFPNVTIHLFLDNVDEQSRYHSYKLEDVSITSYNIILASETLPYEEITFSFTKIIEEKIISPEKEPRVPQWVQTTAKFWVDGMVSDREFVDALGYLVKQKIILVEVESRTGTSGDDKVPTWITQTTRWWISGEVPEDQFLEGIKWMIKNDIIKGIQN